MLRVDFGQQRLSTSVPGLALLTCDQDAFAYAERHDEAGTRYRGLHFGMEVAVAVYDTGLLGKLKLHAHKSIRNWRTPPSPESEPGAARNPASTCRRFDASAEGSPLQNESSSSIPARVGRDANRVADEVITGLVVIVGSTVRVTLGIEADTPAGAVDNVVRTVTVIGRALKFAANCGFDTNKDSTATAGFT